MRSIHILIIVCGFLCAATHYSQAQSAEKTVKSSSPSSSFSRFRFEMNGGLGYLIGSTKNAKSELRSFGVSEHDVDQYYRNFKLGEQVGSSIHYMVKPSWGLGLDYALFTTQSSVMGYIDPGDGWTKYYGPFSQKVYTSFVGISYLQQQQINEKWSFYAKVASGIAFYRNEIYMVVTPMLATGTSYAAMGEMGVSYSLTRYMSVGLGLSDFFSVLRKYKFDNGTESGEVELNRDTQENLSRLSVKAGIQFHF